MKKTLAALALALCTLSALSLAGCAPAESAADDTVRVAAATNVYGSLAAEIGGDRIEVTSIITSSSQDPHSYEASARDRLTIDRADLVITNGGGYDAFMDALLEGTDAAVLRAVEFSHDFPGNAGHHGDDHDDHDDHGDTDDEDHADHDGEDGDHAGHNHIAGFNEHVWFDAHTMIHLVEAIADELSTLDPEGSTEFTTAAELVIGQLEGVEAELASLAESVSGSAVLMTEPLPGYLAAAVGLHDVTPAGFAAAVEEGNDVAPATLLAALDAVAGGQVRAVLTNAQTGGAETTRVEEAARAAGVPVVAFTEVLEEGTTYAEWMQAAIHDLADALQR